MVTGKLDIYELQYIYMYTHIYILVYICKYDALQYTYEWIVKVEKLFVYILWNTTSSI